MPSTARILAAIAIVAGMTFAVRPMIAAPPEPEYGIVLRDGFGTLHTFKATDGKVPRKFSVHLDQAEFDKIREACR